MSAVVGDPLNYIGQTYGILCMFEGLSINTSPHGGAVFCNLLKSENISFVPLEIALTQLLNWWGFIEGNTSHRAHENEGGALWKNIIEFWACRWAGLAILSLTVWETWSNSMDSDTV